MRQIQFTKNVATSFLFQFFLFLFFLPTLRIHITGTEQEVHIGTHLAGLPGNDLISETVNDNEITNSLNTTSFPVLLQNLPVPSAGLQLLNPRFQHVLVLHSSRFTRQNTVKNW